MEEQPPSTNPNGDVALGCALTMMLHMIAIVIMLTLSYTSSSSLVANVATGFLLLLGVSQTVYMGPAVYYACRRSRFDIAKGLIIGAAVTFALNAACWTLVGGYGTKGMFR